ncbi:MAG TPA: hypothetical protein VKV04_19495 [Verrucomicrobiae bacterium]|nr:hypothetical protein [Verrucomicrobiae bacterium]
MPRRHNDGIYIEALTIEHIMDTLAVCSPSAKVNATSANQTPGKPGQDSRVDI